MQSIWQIFSARGALLLALCAGPSPAAAWETDQYTVPSEPLLDVGPQVAEVIYLKLESALARINAGLETYPEELEQLKLCCAIRPARAGALAAHGRFGERRGGASPWLKIRRARWLTRQLAVFESKQGVAKIVSDAIGGAVAIAEKVDGILGLPTDFAIADSERLGGGRTYFSPQKYETIYTLAGFHRGMHAAFFVLSSTINVYGTEFGMDKLGHIFNEGHRYYEIYTEQLASGASPRKARQAAISWGVDTENGIFGLVASGVYSNADLAANLAGLYFYKNLFDSIMLDGQRQPPMLERRAGQYRISEAYRQQPGRLFARFVSETLNEALNPSRVERLQFQPVANALRSRCEDWRARYPHRDWAWYVDKQTELERWNGMEYGHKSGSTVNIGTVCRQAAT